MKCASLVVLALVSAATPADAASTSEAVVAIRTYNYAQVVTARLSSARSVADGIFKRAGISLQWRDCRVPQGDGAACTEPLAGQRDLILRLTDRAAESPTDTGRVVALGTSMLDRERRGGVLMTIDLRPVRTIAEQTLADLPTLLGRAIAHEIGHLLLGSPEHPRNGLMRAFWSQDELRGAKPASWRFSSQEAAQMRHGLAAKGRGAT